MGKSRRNWGFFVFYSTCVVLFAGVFLVSGPVGAQISVSSGSAAPADPAYEKYIAEKGSISATEIPHTADGHCLGYIPPRFKVPALKVPSEAALQTSQIPSKYDLRYASTVPPVHPVGVTPVKDQYGCGSCWAFGAMASLESYLKLNGVKADFSEEDLNENHGWDPPVCMGGNETMATAYMARWAGPVNEADEPYPYWLTEQSSGVLPTEEPLEEPATSAPPVGAAPGVATAYHIQNVYWLPQRASFTDNTAVKQAIIANGAVAVSFYFDDAYYNASTYSYYCNDASLGTNHEIAVVGWDDTWANTKFNSYPPGNGAFIVKNSWGTGWGQSGYFYMSYYDATLHPDAQFYNAEPVTNYTRIYQYDPLGLTEWFDFSGSEATTYWYASVFNASANAKHIEGVSLITPVPNTQYVISVYSNLPGLSPLAVVPTTGTLVRTKSGTIPQAGYHTIHLTAAAVTANKPFSVVVKVTTPGFGYPVPVGRGIPLTTANGACPGQSWISADGTNWSYGNDFKVCLKAFAVK